MNRTVNFNSNDWPAMLELMNNYEDYGTRAYGQNADGEEVNVSIGKDSIVVETRQSNGWVRQNWYWRDGRTEETFEGRWK